MLKTLKLDCNGAVIYPGQSGTTWTVENIYVSEDWTGQDVLIIQCGERSPISFPVSLAR